jgi:hypothetical protein
MRAHDYPLIIKFLVIVLIISKEVVIEVLSFFKRGALLTCLSLTIVPSI